MCGRGCEKQPRSPLGLDVARPQVQIGREPGLHGVDKLCAKRSFCTKRREGRAGRGCRRAESEVDRENHGRSERCLRVRNAARC